MAAVVLGDGVTALLYGGHGEAMDGLYSGSTIGGAFPRPGQIKNDTALLAVVPSDEADSLGVFPYGCAARPADRAELMRVLPSARRDGFAGGAPVPRLGERESGAMGDGGVFVEPGPADSIVGGDAAGGNRGRTAGRSVALGTLDGAFE